MKKKNKGLLIAAICLLLFGTVAIVPSVLTTVPYVRSIITKAQGDTSLTLIETIAQSVQKVTIDAGNADVRIERSKSGELEIQLENASLQSATVESQLVDENLLINVATNREFIQLFSDANQFIEQMASLIARNSVTTLVIGVPENSPVELNVTSQKNVAISEGELLKGAVDVTIGGMLSIADTNSVETTKTLNYEQTGHYYLRVDYQLLNHFSDVQITGDYIDVINDSRSEQLVTKTLRIDANTIQYQYVPMSGTVTLIGENTYVFTPTLVNQSWDIKTSSFAMYAEDINGESEVMNRGIWQFSGQFWPEQASVPGKMIVDSQRFRLEAPNSVADFMEFAQTQPNLEVYTQIWDN